MEEIARFVGGGEGAIYNGMGEIYGRVERSIATDGGDVKVLEAFVDAAKQI